MLVGPGKLAQAIAARYAVQGSAVAGRDPYEIGPSASAGALAVLAASTHALCLAYSLRRLAAIGVCILPRLLNGKQAA